MNPREKMRIGKVISEIVAERGMRQLGTDASEGANEKAAGEGNGTCSTQQTRGRMEGDKPKHGDNEGSEGAQQEWRPTYQPEDGEEDARMHVVSLST